MKLDEAQLSRAAVLVRERQLQQLPDANTCPEHVFSDVFEQNMQELIEQLARGEIRQKKAALGWPYYVRQGLVAVLICFLLACFTMPETVLAGYHKLIEVVETVFEEYTEWRYYSNIPGNTEFVPMKIGYLPEGMQRIEQDTGNRSHTLVFRNGESYFTLEQIILTEEDGLGYIADTENAQIEKQKFGQEEILFILKNESYNYVWIHEKYFITGQSNLAEEEIIKILESSTF